MEGRELGMLGGGLGFNGWVGGFFGGKGRGGANGPWVGWNSPLGRVID